MNLKRLPWRRLLLLVLALAVLYLAWETLVPVNAEQLALGIAPGDNAAVIAQKLHQRGLIRNRNIFLALAKLRGTDRSLKAGTYSIGGHSNLLGVLNMLEKGSTSAIRITFPEGLSLRQTLLRIERSGLASLAELQAASADTALVRSLTGMRVPSLEGWLYPETYYFDLSSTPQSILSQMTRQFFSKLASAGVKPDSLPDFYRRLILASIVEKESAHPDERGLIAGVFQNRLDKGIHLQSCATVDYVLETRGIKHKVLSFRDIREQSPYNTYQNKGLPPGPICNPSLGSILAALQPARTNYLYFVANRKGRNDFSATGEEHFAKIRQYKRAEWR